MNANESNTQERTDNELDAIAQQCGANSFAELSVVQQNVILNTNTDVVHDSLGDALGAAVNSQ